MTLKFVLSFTGIITLIAALLVSESNFKLTGFLLLAFLVQLVIWFSIDWDRDII